MEHDREEQIRRRAYELWESEERPQGEDIRHWMQAAQELEADEPPPIAASRDGPDADALLNGAGEAGILESSRNESGQGFRRRHPRSRDHHRGKAGLPSHPKDGGAVRTAKEFLYLARETSIFICTNLT